MESLLWQEIHEQPGILSNLSVAQYEPISRLGAELRKREYRFILLAARGTSDNAARYGQYLFGFINRLPVALAAPSLFTMYKRPPLLEGALVIGISQSGESPDIVAVLNEARLQGAPTLAVTNAPDSPLGRAAEYILPLAAGEERSVAATKTYTAQLAVLAMLSLALQNRLREDSLQPVIPWMQEALRHESHIRAAAQRIADSNRAVVLGRGFHYCTAHEIALKIKELSGITAEPYSTADFLHGPVAMADTGLPVIFLSIGATFQVEMESLAQRVRQQGAQVVWIGEEQKWLETADLYIPAPVGEPEWLNPISTVLPGQLLAMHLTIARGWDPDQPRHIRKVTRTR